MSFDAIGAPDPPEINYTLDTPGFSFGAYQFSQQPDCGYAITITVENLPEPFVEHNEDDRRFSIARTSDPQFLGEYEVTLRGQFDQLNIDRTTTTVEQTIIFTIIASPCQIITYNAVEAPDPEIHYTLDTPGFNIGPYEFS